ncbi:MAG: insulinase family protein [Candidatus Aminicenantes bacterium]|nr:insulinase family protein [Candidatus Aminicenantes bacterium]
MKKCLTAIILICVLHISINAFYKVEKFYLSNGLTVLLSPDENTGAACVLVYHKTGARDDPQSLKGATHLYRNLMLLGTRNLDPLDRKLFVEKSGGVSNRKVNYDNSVFYQVIPATELNHALWLESERLTSLNLTDQAINFIKNSDYRRIYNMINSHVNFEANKEVKSIVFEDTVYQIPEYGSPEEIRSFNNREIKKLYANFRNPEEIILVIAGNFDIEGIKKLVNRHFAGLPSREAVNKKYTLAGPRGKYVYKNWLRSNVAQQFSMYGIRAPSKFDDDHLYFNFIRYYLADERISKLEKMMNRKNKLKVTIHSEYTNHFESNALIIKISTTDKTALQTAKFILNKELNALAARPLSQSELRMTKSLMEIDFKKDMAVLEKKCLIIAENVHLFGNLDFEKNYIDRIRNITSYDIMKISKNYLRKSNRVILNVHPQ